MTPGEFRAHLENCISGHDRQSRFARTAARDETDAARFCAASPNPTFNTLMDRADSAAEISDAAQQRDENFLIAAIHVPPRVLRFSGPRTNYSLKPLLSRKNSCALFGIACARNVCATGVSEIAARLGAGKIGGRIGQ